MSRTVCVPVTTDGTMDPRWGRAARVAVATVDGGDITDWREYPVGWDVAHDSGTGGAHHARVARFLLDHEVDTVIANHMGDGMFRMLDTMGVTIRVGASGDARAVIRAASAG